MKKIETLQELEAEVLRLNGVKNEFKIDHPELNQMWFHIENVSVDVLFQAEGLFNGSVSEKGDRLRLQYCKFDLGSDFILFAHSVPVIKTNVLPIKASEFAEAS